MKGSNPSRVRNVALACAVVVTLAACGSDDAKSTADTAASTTLPAKDRTPTTLTLWSSFGDTDTIKAFQPIMQRCETDNPWLTIDYVAKDDMSTALAAAAEAGKEPDLVQADFSGGLAKLEASGIAEPLDSRASRDGFDWNQFTKSGQQLVEFEGKHWGIPFSVDPVALFYNQDVLDRAGVQVPKTYDDLLAVSKRLVQRDAKGNLTRVGFVPDVGDGSYIMASARVFGGSVFNEDGTEITLTDGDAWPRMLRSQQQFYDIVGFDALTRFSAGFGSYDSSENFFIKGQVPLYLEASYFVTWPGRFGKGTPAKWGVMPLPTPPGAKQGAAIIASGNSFFIPKKAKDVEASWIAARCMATAAKEISDFQLFNGNIPSNLAALDSFAKVQVAKIPQFQTFIDIARADDPLEPSNGLTAETAYDEIVKFSLSYRRGNVKDADLEKGLADLDSKLQDDLDLELGN